MIGKKRDNEDVNEEKTRGKREREWIRFLFVLSLVRALIMGPFQTSSRVTSLPMGMPR